MQTNCLFDRITLVTADDQGRIVTTPNACVTVSGGFIRYVGQNLEAARESMGHEPFDCYDGRSRIILPALANLHGHIAMSIFRNQTDDKNLQDWLINEIFPREARLSREIVRIGTRLGLAEMIRSGTGAAADMYYFEEAVAEAALDAGFRVNLCCDAKQTLTDGRVELLPERLSDRIRTCTGHASDLLRVSLLVHSVYLYDKGLYPDLADMAAGLDCPVQIHVSETRKEVEDCLRQFGCRPPRQLEKFGFFRTPTLAAHCTFLNEEDRQILARHKVVAAHNPTSNLKLGSGIADVPAMLAAGMQVGLGTDSAASNNNLDLYREMRLASFLAKGLTGDASVLPAASLLDMTTRTGMAGLGFSGSGRIAAGAAADLQIINHDCPAMTPLGDPVSALVYSADVSCVESLMIAGRWLMKNRELTTIDEEKLLYEARVVADRINAGSEII